MAQKMGAKLARDKKRRLRIEEDEVDLKEITRHKNRDVAALAMYATSKPPFDTAEGFYQSALVKVKSPVTIVMGEFDPNLLASPGGAYEVCSFLKENKVVVDLLLIDSAGHASVKLLPETMGKVLLNVLSEERVASL